MTRDDQLRLLLVAADDVGRVFDHVETADWPPGALREFERVGILRAAAGGLAATCPNCAERHVEPVTVRMGADGRRRLFIRCPEDLRVEVAPEMCLGWEVDPGGLARAVSRAMALTGSPKSVMPDRLWRLGRIPWEGRTREVLLARRMGDADAASVAAHVGSGGRSIVLVPHRTPDERIWPGRVPAVVALSWIATAEGGGLVIDGVALVGLVHEADAFEEARSELPVDPERRKQLVRRQVKAEIKSLLSDDALVAAYKEHGSFREAAKAIAEQTGQPISKDKVKRAVDRRGGIAEIAEADDSASVSRRVASHSRDRQKKFLERR